VAASDAMSSSSLEPIAGPQPVHELQTAEPLPARIGPVPTVAKVGVPSLGTAQAELGRGNIAAALDMYGKLIRKGRSLEEIIRDLRDALYRYPVEVPIWQALGDAYMRANRLQEALDAYTKAEELLR
jgi:tetratricopeptide (TPR) repeat protein